MNDDYLKVLQGEKYKEDKKKLIDVQASIEKEKMDTYDVEEMVCNYNKTIL